MIVLWLSVWPYFVLPWVGLCSPNLANLEKLGATTPQLRRASEDLMNEGTLLLAANSKIVYAIERD